MHRRAFCCQAAAEARHIADLGWLRGTLPPLGSTPCCTARARSLWRLARCARPSALRAPRCRHRQRGATAPYGAQSPPWRRRPLGALRLPSVLAAPAASRPCAAAMCCQGCSLPPLPQSLPPCPARGAACRHCRRACRRRHAAATANAALVLPPPPPTPPWCAVPAAEAAANATANAAHQQHPADAVNFFQPQSQVSARPC